jgi:hypothetical protein
MKFRNGEEALQWLAENRSYDSIKSQPLSRITDDMAVFFNYSIKILRMKPKFVKEPKWVNIVDNVIDIENIFKKSLSDTQKFVMLQSVYNYSFKKGGNKTYYRGLKKFEISLRRHGFISDNAEFRYHDNVIAFDKCHAPKKVSESVKKAA